MTIATKIGVALQVMAISSVAGCFATLPYRDGGDLLLVDSKTLEALEKRHGRIAGVESVSNAQSGNVYWFKGNSASQEQFRSLLNGARYCLAETGPGAKYYRCYFTRGGHEMVKSLLYPMTDAKASSVSESKASKEELLSDYDLMVAAENWSQVNFARQINDSFFWAALVSPFIFLSGTLSKHAGSRRSN